MIIRLILVTLQLDDGVSEEMKEIVEKILTKKRRKKLETKLN